LGYINLVVRTKKELNLLTQIDVSNFFKNERPEYVFLAAAKVGGILVNNIKPAQFIYENLMIQSNVIHSSFINNVKRLMFFGSTCIYPKNSCQPISESSLLTGELEKTNEPYAVSKIAGIKMCESYNREFKTDFRSIMPTNLYGINDNFDPNDSHVVAALIKKFHEAKINGSKTVEVWGSGEPMREFMHVDDLADAAVFLMKLDKSIYEKFVSPTSSHINVGTGTDCSIKYLAELIKKITDFKGDIKFDKSKPDGTYRKQVDTKLLTKMGWKSKIELEKGLQETYEWCKEKVFKL